MTTWRDRQRGAVTLMGALFLIITLALMIEVLHRSAGSDILDTAAQNSSVEALFLAESGLENATARLVSGSCDASLSGTYNLGNGAFTIEDLGAGFNTDFSGNPLPSGQCRVRVTGAVPVLGAQRVVEAIVQSSGNLLASVNPDFNEVIFCFGGCWLRGWLPPWSLPPWLSTDATGGPDGSRAIVATKGTGAAVSTSARSWGLTPFAVTGGDTLTLSFDYSVVGSGGGPNTNKAEFEFGVWDGTTLHSAAAFRRPATSGFVTAVVTIPIAGSGPLTITEFRFTVTALAGQPKNVWLDNLFLQGPGGGGNVGLLQWREVISN